MFIELRNLTLFTFLPFSAGYANQTKEEMWHRKVQGIKSNDDATNYYNNFYTRIVFR